MLKKLLIISLLCLPSFFAFAEDREEISPEIPHEIRISILGTSYYSDVKFIMDSVRRFDKKNTLTRYMSSKNIVILSGLFYGEVETMISDLEHLSQNRFKFEITQNEPNLFITLRKLSK